MNQLKLPPDPDEMNDDRAKWAHAAIVTFQRETGTDLEDALADLLCDLRHWADREGYDYAHEDSRAAWHYGEETDEGGLSQ